MSSSSILLSKVNLADTLKVVLKKRDMSMATLAARVGVYPSTIKTILEKNRASIPRLIQFSKVLNFNFFKLYANAVQIAEPLDFAVAAKDEEIDALNSEIASLKKELEMKDVEIKVMRQVLGVKVNS